ncbi:hypothetical protein [Paracidovorax sp. MALMAid1276]|uniref:hypothetical protein n=1 Tax=Paracidovorax sp. MALMAid1276 TaxID=3411631 RepID=UPI003B9C1A2A
MNIYFKEIVNESLRTVLEMKACRDSLLLLPQAGDIVDFETDEGKTVALFKVLSRAYSFDSVTGDLQQIRIVMEREALPQTLS